MDDITTPGGRSKVSSRTSSSVADPLAHDAGQRHETRHESTLGLKDRIRDTASSQLNRQKDRATDGLGTVAQAVRQTTQQLRDQNQSTTARYVEQAADQLQRLSDGLKNKDIGELVKDAQRLARRQPALFIGGAFALGLIGARFLKSSPPDSDSGYRYGTVGTVGVGEYDRTVPVPPDVTTASRDTSGTEDF